MIALALVCLLLAAAAVAFVLFVSANQTIAFSFFAGDFVTRPIWVFVAGAATLLVALAGLWFFRRGTQRNWAKRREIKRLRRVEETAVVAEPSVSRSQPSTHTAQSSDSGNRAAGSSAVEETLVRESRRDDGTRLG